MESFSVAVELPHHEGGDVQRRIEPDTVNWPKVPREITQQTSDSAKALVLRPDIKELPTGPISNNVTISVSDQKSRSTDTDIACPPTSSLQHSAPQGSQQTALQKSAEQTASFYENAKKVPGTDQYIYQQAQVLISRQYHERYLILLIISKELSKITKFSNITQRISVTHYTYVVAVRKTQLRPLSSFA